MVATVPFFVQEFNVILFSALQGDGDRTLRWIGEPAGRTSGYVVGCPGNQTGVAGCVIAAQIQHPLVVRGNEEGIFAVIGRAHPAAYTVAIIICPVSGHRR